MRNLKLLMMITTIETYSVMWFEKFLERMVSSGMLCRVVLQEPHGVISQKTPFFIVTNFKGNNF
jgi:hypothetical protein